MHNTCYEKMVKARHQTNKDKYTLIGIDAAKSEAKQCPHCRRRLPNLNALSIGKQNELK